MDILYVKKIGETGCLYLKMVVICKFRFLGLMK